MSGGPVTRLLLRLKRGGGPSKAPSAGAQERPRHWPRPAARAVALDDATLDRLAAQERPGRPAGTVAPDAFKRFTMRLG